MLFRSWHHYRRSRICGRLVGLVDTLQPVDGVQPCHWLCVVGFLLADLENGGRVAGDGAPFRPPARHCSRRRHCHCKRSEEHTSELQSLMRISYAVFCLKKKTIITRTRARDEEKTRITHVQNEL